MYGKILIAVDGSDSNKYAIDDALKLAKEFGSEVTALYVFDHGNYAGHSHITPGEDYILQSAQVALKYVQEQGKAVGITVKPKTITGSPAPVIVDESVNFDLVVCGSLGRSGLSRAVMGSVAERVARFSACPVLICRKPK